MSDQPLSDLLDVNEAAAVLRETPRALQLWRSQKKGPRWVKFGKHVRYDRRDIQAYIDQHRQEVSA